MRKYLYYLFGFILILPAGCRRPQQDEPCDVAPPAVTGLNFRVLDSTGVDLLIAAPSGFKEDSLCCAQPCYAGNPVALFQHYPVPGSGQASVFSFANIRNPALGEAADCFTLYLRWNAADEDTVAWHYHNEQNGKCIFQVLDFMTFNGHPVNKVDVGTFSYWALRK